MNRDCKDVIAFDPGDHLNVVEKMQLDLYEPPMSQVRQSKLFVMGQYYLKGVNFCRDLFLWMRQISNIHRTFADHQIISIFSC